MQEIEKIAHRLNGDLNLSEIRLSIATLMLDKLYAIRETPMHWEKTHFANAVAALGMNIHAIQQPTHSWLRLCLVDLRKAFESIRPDLPYTEVDRHLDAITLEELTITIETLCEQVNPKFSPAST